MPKRVYLTLNGVTRNVTEWSKRTGVSRVTLYMRLRAGWSVVDALTLPTTAPTTLTHGGCTLSLGEWSRRSGIPATTIRMRLNGGWSVADAVTLPVRSRPRQRKRGVASNFSDISATGAPSNAVEFS